jgi:hypothetical protein
VVGSAVIATHSLARNARREVLQGLTGDQQSWPIRWSRCSVIGSCAPPQSFIARAAKWAGSADTVCYPGSNTCSPQWGRQHGGALRLLRRHRRPVHPDRGPIHRADVPDLPNGTGPQPRPLPRPHRRGAARRAEPHANLGTGTEGRRQPRGDRGDARAVGGGERVVPMYGPLGLPGCNAKPTSPNSSSENAGDHPPPDSNRRVPIPAASSHRRAWLSGCLQIGWVWRAARSRYRPHRAWLVADDELHHPARLDVRQRSSRRRAGPLPH